jgi:glycosyltransferase involved in cell wall biosynthesis
MTDAPPRIAILTSGYLPVIDGVTVSLHERLLRLSAWGYPTLVLCPSYESAARHYPDWRGHTGAVLPGIEVLPLPSQPFFGLEWDRNPSWASRSIVRDKLREFRPEFFVVIEPERQSLGYRGRPGLRAARREKIPVAAEYHTNFVDYLDDWLPLPRWLRQLCMAVVRRYVALIYNGYAATFTASDAAKAKVSWTGIGNAVSGPFIGIDTRKFHPASKDRALLAEKFGIRSADDQVIVTFLGRLTPDKGWRFLLDALPALASRIAPERVLPVVAGDGQMADEIKMRLGAVFPALRMLGRVAPADVPDLLRHSDLHVTSSEKETLGLTVLEAQACGIPVLVPRIGSFLQTVSDGVSGLLYENRNGEDFVGKLVTLVGDADLRRRLGAAGPTNVRQRDWDEATHAWIKALAALSPKAARI